MFPEWQEDRLVSMWSLYSRRRRVYPGWCRWLTFVDKCSVRCKMHIEKYKPSLSSRVHSHPCEAVKLVCSSSSRLYCSFLWGVVGDGQFQLFVICNGSRFQSHANNAKEAFFIFVFIEFLGKSARFTYSQGLVHLCVCVCVSVCSLKSFAQVIP